MEAEIWATQKKWAEAEKALRAGLRAEPSSTSSAAKLHTVLWQSGRTADAQAFAKKWLEDKPKDVRMWTYLGEDALKRKDYKSAAEHLEAAAALEPDAVQNAVTLNNLAFAQGQTGDPRAIETGERALRLVPNSADINDTLGTLYLKKGDGARAMEYFDKAKKLAPNRLDLRMNYAKALATTGKKDAARKEFEALQGEKADFRGKSEIPELLKTL
jgi:uncharacterized protein HemY